MAAYFKDSAWEKAYVQRDMRNTLSEFAAGARAAFDAEVVGVTGEFARANDFNGINVSGTNYVNLNGADKIKYFQLRKWRMVRCLLLKRLELARKALH